MYAAGDCAEIEANPLPATAQVAQQQGRYIAKGAFTEIISSQTRGSNNKF